MKKLLLLLLFIPSLSLGQSIESWDVVREGYYKVVVGQDTLQDNFTRYDTALKKAYDSAENSAQGLEIKIIPPSYRFEYSYVDIDTTSVTETVYDTANVESLALRNVNLGYQNISGERSLSYEAEAHGDSVLFEYFHNGQSLQKSLQYPKGGIVRDTLKDPPLDSIQVWVHGYWDKWVEPYHEIVNTAFLDTLGGGELNDITKTDTTMATYVLDNFEDTDGTQLQNHTPDTDAVGNGWSIVPLFGETNTGDTDIQNNEARVNVDNTGAVIDAGQSDVSVWAEWYPPVGGTGRATIPFRYSDADNHWLVNMREENGDIGLSKIVNGGNNFHVESTSFTWNEGQTYEIEVRLSGDSIRVFVDGTEVTEIARTDNFNNTATQYGIGRATSDGAQPFPRFKVDDGAGFGGDQNVTVSEAGVGADSINLSADMSIADSGQGSDSPTISASASVQDAGSGADSIISAIQAAVQDAGAGAGSVGVDVFADITDVGAGSDSPSIAATINIADQGLGTDTINVLKEVLKTVSDSGIGSDNVSANVSLSVSDQGSGSATPVIQATIPVSDQGAGADAINVLKEIVKTVSDAGSGSDQVNITAELSVEDSGQGQDSPTINVALNVSDQGGGVESIATIQEKLVQVADAGQGVGDVSVNVHLQLSEQGFANEVIGIQNTLTVLDQGQGVDIASQFDSDVFITDIQFTFYQRQFEYAFKQRSINYQFQQRSMEFAFIG